MYKIGDTVVTERDGDDDPGVIIQIMDGPDGEKLYCVKNESGHIWFDASQLNRG